MTTVDERTRAAVDVARDALGRDVLADDVEDAVRSDNLLLLLASATDDLDLAVVDDAARPVEDDLDDAVDDVEALAKWRARNVAQSVGGGEA